MSFTRHAMNLKLGKSDNIYTSVMKKLDPDDKRELVQFLFIQQIAFIPDQYVELI